VKILFSGRQGEQSHKFLRIIEGLYPGRKGRVQTTPGEDLPKGSQSVHGELSRKVKQHLLRVYSAAGRGRSILAVNAGEKFRIPDLSRIVRQASRYGWRTLLTNERWLIRIRTAIIYLLIIALSQSVARLTWALLSSPDLEVQEAAPTTEITGAVEQANRASSIKADLGDKLAGLHLFGMASPAAVEMDPSALMEAPATTLSLALKGIIAVIPEERALAIISEKAREGNDQVYGIGETVPGNAIIQGIYADRVILLRAGKLETLYLETEGEPRSREVARPVAGRPQKPITRGYVAERMANLPDLAKEVGVQVHTRDGRQQGYELVSAHGSEFLTSLGLQAGDIIYEANGIRFSDASGALTAYEQLKEMLMTGGSREIQLVIERDGVRQTKTVSLQ
jgi:general secretion pathway protein C